MHFTKLAIVTAMIFGAAAAPMETRSLELRNDMTDLEPRSLKSLISSSRKSKLQMNVVGTNSICIAEFSKQAALKQWTRQLKKTYTKCEISVSADDSGGQLNFYNGNDKSRGVIMNFQLFKPLDCT
ncbi:hypothetical protein C8J56DRAFT_1031631 [Mycena floridula]|nr:hypothetical protein C8J56DRAFT_1031631 [Mycena floridula]